MGVHGESGRGSQRGKGCVRLKSTYSHMAAKRLADVPQIDPLNNTLAGENHFPFPKFHLDYFQDNLDHSVWMELLMLQKVIDPNPSIIVPYCGPASPS